MKFSTMFTCIKETFALLLSCFIFLQPNTQASAEPGSPSHPIETDLQSLPLAPLIPLEPQFPLGLSESNRQQLIDNPKQLERNKKIIEKFLEMHSFPWLSFTILLFCGGIGWVLFLLRDQWFRHLSSPLPRLTPKKKMNELLQELDKKELDHDPPPEHYAAFSSIISNALQAKSGIKTDSLTTTQISQIIKNQSFLSFQEIEEDLSLLSKIDHVKFGGKVPSQTETGEISKKIHIFVRQILE